MASARIGQSIVTVARITSATQVRIGQSIVTVAISSAVQLQAQCNNPPQGQIGTQYTHTFTATGGTAPYTFTVSAGTFPPGLTLASDGSVTGLPASVGTFSFTIRVQDSVGITALIVCSISIISPQRGTGSGGGPGGKKECCAPQPEPVCVDEAPKPKGDCNRLGLLQSVFRKRH